MNSCPESGHCAQPRGGSNDRPSHLVGEEDRKEDRWSTQIHFDQREGAKALLDLPRRWKIPGGGFPTATSGPSHCAGSIALHRNYGSAATNRWAHRSSPSSVVEKPLSQDFDGPSKSPLNCRGAVSGWSVVWHSVSMRRLSRERCSDVRRESDRRCRI